MARLPQNVCHPMAAQARIKAQLAADAANKPVEPTPPPPPSKPSPSGLNVETPTDISNREKLETLPDEDLVELARTHGVDDTAPRATIIAELDAAGVEL